MTARMVDRLQRLEQATTRGADAALPGMIPVLMYGIATRLGGYPRAEDTGPARAIDGVSDGLARGLGYADWAEMDGESRRDVNAWGSRMDRGVTELLRTEGVERHDDGDAQVFRALVRILDAAPALAGREVGTGWGDVGAQLDEWIRFCGLSPEAIRREAHA